MRTGNGVRARIALGALVALALLLLGGRALITVRDADISDFRCVYEAARLVRLGQDPYDRSAWAAATRSDPARVPPCNETFIYPLWTAVAFVPASLVPERAALALWDAATLAFLVIASALLARTWRAPGLTRPLLAVVLWSQPAFSLVANAQLGGAVLLGLAGLSLALARGRAARAAAWWAVLLLKPHVTIVPLAGAFLASGRRVALLAAAGAAAVVLASLALAPSWPAELWREVAPQGRLADPGVDTFWGLAAATGVSAAWAVVASLVAVATIWLLLPRRRLLPAELIAVLVPVSLVVTPYARAHDQVALAVAWAAVLVVAGRAGPRGPSLAAATVLVALVLPWTLTVLGLVGLPIATRVLVAYASGLLVAYALRHGDPAGRAEPSATN